MCTLLTLESKQYQKAHQWEANTSKNAQHDMRVMGQLLISTDVQQLLFNNWKGGFKQCPTSSITERLSAAPCLSNFALATAAATSKKVSAHPDNQQ